MGFSEPNRCKPNQSTKRQHIYISLMVKMGIDLDLLGSFGLFWVGDNVQGRNLSNSKFWILSSKSLNLEVQKK